MNDFLLFLHFVGLMFGAAGGLASAILMRKALSLPEDQARVARSFGPTLANVSAVGLGLLWATGLILVWSKWQGFGSLPSLFWVKAIFIATLTLASIAIHMTYARIRKGEASAAALLPKLGPASGLSAFLATLFAAYTFS